MRVIAVPVKALARAKMRLAAILAPAERAEITLAMLDDVLAAALPQPGWETWVVSPDDRVLVRARAAGARAVVDVGRSLRDAVRQVEAMSPAHELAVVLADLPLVDGASLSRPLATEADVVASPASSDGGTNVLVRRPARVIPARFGRNSLAKHRAAADRAGVRFETVVSRELGFDLDRPADIEALVATDSPSQTRRVCIELGLGERLRERVGSL